jgi:hypothetical protein
VFALMIFEIHFKVQRFSDKLPADESEINDIFLISDQFHELWLLKVES